MITDNEVYSDLLKIDEKIKFLSNPKNTNSEKANFWKIILNELEDIIKIIRKDKKLYGW